MRCMESLTALRMPKMEVSASCRSSAPSQPLLYLSISCSQKHTSSELGHRDMRLFPKRQKHSLTFSSSWYLVILWTGFSRYESKPSLCSSFFWHSWKQEKCKKVTEYVMSGTGLCSRRRLNLPGRRRSLNTASRGSQTEVYCDSTSHRSAGQSSEEIKK